MAVFGAFVLLVLCEDCGPSIHWMREDLHPREVRGERRLDEVRIWSGKVETQWRAVLVTEDSITGIPRTTSPMGDSSRVRLPLSAVDSIQVGYVQAPDYNLLWEMPVGILLALGLCALAHCK